MSGWGEEEEEKDGKWEKMKRSLQESRVEEGDEIVVELRGGRSIHILYLSRRSRYLRTKMHSAKS